MLRDIDLQGQRGRLVCNLGYALFRQHGKMCMSLLKIIFQRRISRKKINVHRNIIRNYRRIPNIIDLSRDMFVL